ncbi:MAG TPA: DUF4440 domain-containing protein [Candidatus Krumholzibacteria bacterium]|nr:DUF4440 domain-containing protein [Candidatus Krumholzibacteria bacterium]
MRQLALIAVLLIAPASALAQPAEQAPCWHAEFDAFSFLPGEWTVHAEDRLGNGTWETTDARCWVTKELRGCMLSVRYFGSRAGGPFEARGYYGFDSIQGKLQQVWIDGEHGMLVTYAGSKVGDAIVLDYPFVLRGQPTILRAVYSEISKDAFHLEDSRSSDGGKTWDVTSRYAFTRVPAVETKPLPSIELPKDLARVLTDYETGWRNKDEKALASLFTEDGFVLSSGNPPVRGRAAIEKHYQESGGALSLRALEYATNGDTGFIIGAYTYEGQKGDVGKFTLTLAKGKGGRWLIVSDMDNSNRR